MNYVTYINLNLNSTEFKKLEGHNCPAANSFFTKKEQTIVLRNKRN